MTQPSVQPTDGAAVSYARRTKFGNLSLHAPSELSNKKGHVVVVAGRSNAGKSTLLNTLFDSKRIQNVLIGDARGRTHVLPDREGLYIAKLNNFADFSNFNTELVKHPTDFDAVCIDTFSEVQGQDLKARGLYEADEKLRLKIYGDSHMDMTDRTRVLYDLATQYGVHIVLTLWVKPGKDASDTDITKLMLTNQFGEYFRGVVDYIGMLTLNDGIVLYPPVLSFQPSNTTPQKFSPPAALAAIAAGIPRTIYNPSLGHIIDTLCGDPFPLDLHKRPQRQ